MQHILFYMDSMLNTHSSFHRPNYEKRLHGIYNSAQNRQPGRKNYHRHTTKRHIGEEAGCKSLQINDAR